MRVLRVQLTQIKSYDEQVVTLEAGTNSICGENGAGKTTIVEAIGWALFDSLPYGNQKQFVRDGSTWGQVSVLFKARDGREYEVVRRAGSGSHWYVFDPEIGDRLAEGSSDVRDWLRRQLGTEDSVEPKVLFENAVGVPQGGLTAPFLQSGEKRKGAFDPILRVHEYAQAFDELRETRAYALETQRDAKARADTASVEAEKVPAIKESIAGVSGQVTLDERTLARKENERAQQEVVVSALEAREKRIGELRGEAALLGQALSAARSSVAQARARVEQSRAARRKVGESRGAHEAYVRALEKIRELQPLHVRYLKLSGELDGERREVGRLSRELEQVATQIADARGAEEELPAREIRAREATDTQEKIRELETAVRKVRDLENEAKALAEQVIRYKRSGQTRLEEIGRIDRLQGDARKLQGLRAEREGLAVKVQSAREARGRLEEWTRTVAKLETQLAGAEAKRRELSAATRLEGATEQVAAALPEVQAEAKKAEEKRNDLRVEHATIKAQKEAKVVACPLKRDDCLTLQRDDGRAKRLDAELDRILREGRAAKSEHERCVARVGEAEAAVARVQTAQRHLAALEPVRAMVESLRAQHADATARIQGERALTEGLPRLEEEQAKVETLLRVAEHAAVEVGRLEDLREAARAERDRLEETLDRETSVREQLEQIRGSAQELEQVRQEYALLKDAAEQLARARFRAAALPGLLAQQTAATGDRDAAVARAAVLETELEPFSGVEDEKAKAEVTLSECRGGHEAYLGSTPLAAELPGREGELHTAEDAERSRSAELEGKQADLQVQEKRWSAPALAEARSRLGALEGEIGALSANIANQRARLAELRETLRVCEEQARVRDEALAHKRRVEEVEELLRFARDTIKEAQKPVTEALLLGVSGEARQLYAEIVDDHSARLSWSPSYEILLERGSERLAFPQMSGGEQMSAALAVRLALLKKLSDVDIAFLDEPTQNMDETRRTNLAQQVGGVRGFEQLFVISHDDTFERQLNHAVVVRKQDGVSVVSYAHEES